MVTSAVISKDIIMTDSKVSNNKTEVPDELNDEPSFSDPENFEDDIEDSELLEDVLRTKPNEEGIVDAVIVVDGIPRVGEPRMQKLKDILGKIFRKVGTVLSEYYPEEVDSVDGAVKTKGYCFIEYETKAAAEDAAEILNGYKLDKTHAFIVTSFRNFEKLQNVENLDLWEAPKRRPYKNFVNQTFFMQIFQHWSDSFVRWSPFGTYIATVHKQGVALRGGENFEQIMRFMHMGVQYLDFSPCENFIITYAPPKSKYTDVPDAIKIWTVRTGELKRSFSAAGETIKRWPHFRWSYNDEYFATLGKYDVLCIYDTKTFTPLDKVKWKIDNIRDFQWSPQQNVIAYWVAEADQRPSRAAILSVPDKEELRSMNTINLAEASIHWQKSGDNICFKADRYGKKKVENDETKYSNLSIQLLIVHMSVKDYPISTIDLKDSVQAFSWEPVGSKFCMIQGDMKSSIVIYGIKSTQQKQIAVTQL
uniref:RRM domain-containing protein n=1 Tax=Romanomermis culicivorax TaxID=13658 RepID=A0A915J7W6_ROMCU